MAEQFRVSLHHPVLVFVWGFSLLLIGCFIGTHWHPSRIAILFIAAAGALLMVVHEVFYGFLWISLTAWWIGMHPRGDQSTSVGNHLRW
jgi:predicted membrane protein